MFDLLTPVFAVAGAAAAAIPILLHMLRRTPSQKMMFSVVRFLRPSLPQMTRRSTIEHWPLMLLRILAIALIGLAFARPFQRLAIPGSAVEGSVNRVALLIDSSASMRRDGIREEVEEEVRRVVGELKPSDILSIHLFSRTSRNLISAEEWNKSSPGERKTLVDQAVQAFEPDWMETRTAAALLNASDDVSRESVAEFGRIGERRIVVVTDFQRGSQLDELRSAVWPDSVSVDLRIVRPTTVGNAGISSATDDAQGRPRIRLTSSADAQRSDFVLQPFDMTGTATGNPIKVNVAPGQRRLLVVPAGGDSAESLIAGVELLEDDHPFDNVIDLPLLETPAVRIAHAGPSDFNNPELQRYYLQRVLDGNDVEPVDVVDVQQGDVTLPIETGIRLVIATDVVPEGLIPSIRGCLDRGGMLLASLTSVEALNALSGLFPEPLTAEEAIVSDYAMLGKVDFSSPVFSSFADARFSDFSSIRFWHYRRVTLPQNSETWRVVAAFDNGDPAIIESAVAGGGRLLLYLSGWHPDDSQWALSTRFPPMIAGIVRQSNPRRAGQSVFQVGETVFPAEIVGSDDWTIRLPDGSEQTAEKVRELQAAELQATGSQPAAAAAAGNAESIADGFLLREPGRYLLTGRTDAGEKSESLIVGLSSAETRTDPLPVGQLQALGLPAVVRESEFPESEEENVHRASQLNSAELESRQKLWRWLLLAGLGCLMLEAVIAGGLERRQRVESAA